MSASVVENLTLGSKKDLKEAQQDIITGSKQMDDIAKKYSKGKYALYARTVNSEDINKLTGYDKENNKSMTFYWLDNNEWKQNIKDGSETNENLKEINSFKSNLVSYDNQNYDNLSFYIKENSKLYNMLYLDDNKDRALYWTTTNYINVTENYVSYGYNAVKYDSLNYDNLVYSSGNSNEITRGIRVIVAVK